MLLLTLFVVRLVRLLVAALSAALLIKLLGRVWAAVASASGVFAIGSAIGARLAEGGAELTFTIGRATVVVGELLEEMLLVTVKGRAGDGNGASAGVSITAGLKTSTRSEDNVGFVGIATGPLIGVSAATMGVPDAESTGTVSKDAGSGGTGAASVAVLLAGVASTEV